MPSSDACRLLVRAGCFMAAAFSLVLLAASCGDTSVNFPLSDVVSLRVGERADVDVLANDHPAGELRVIDFENGNRSVASAEYEGDTMRVVGRSPGTSIVSYQVRGPGGLSRSSLTVLVSAADATATPVPSPTPATERNADDLVSGDVTPTPRPTVGDGGGSTAAPTPTPTELPPTSVPTPTPTPMPTSSPSATATPTSTATATPSPTATLSPTPIPPTVTPTPIAPTPTPTAIPPTVTPTPVPPQFVIDVFVFGNKGSNAQVVAPAPLVVEVTNVGPAPIPFVTLGVQSGGEAEVYVDATGSCDAQLPPGQTCAALALVAPVPWEYRAGMQQAFFTADAQGTTETFVLNFLYREPAEWQFTLDPQSWGTGDLLTVDNGSDYDVTIETTEVTNSGSTPGNSCDAAMDTSCSVEAISGDCWLRVEAVINGWGRLVIPDAPCVW